MTATPEAPRDLIRRAHAAARWVWQFELSECGTRVRWLAVLLISTVIALLTWPITTRIGPVGLDASFVVGLHMAAADRLLVGAEIVSTYGPLGFLAFPQPYVGATSAAAMGMAALVHIGLCSVLFWRAATVYPALVAALLAFVTARAAGWLGIPETTLAAVVVASVACLHLAVGGYRVRGWIWVAAGVVGGIAALGKLNTGAVALCVILLTAAAASRPWWRGVALATAGSVASSVIVWLAVGQGVGNILSFFATSASVALGYSAAMGLDQAATIHWMVWAAALVGGVLAYLGWEVSRTWSTWQRLSLLLVGLALAFVTGKAAFVRWHYTFAFATALIVLFAFMTPRVRRRDLTLGYVAVLIGFLATTASTPAEFAASRAGEAATQAQTLTDESLRTASYTKTLDEMLLAYAVEPDLLQLLEGRSTHVAPSEAGVALVYPEIDWRPLPVFQDYFVYTAHLDDTNARALSTSDGPERILRQGPVAIDTRNPWFEGPAAQLAMLCHYSELAASARWQVLARSPSRCGESVVVKRIEGRVGDQVQVPDAPRDHILTAVVGGLDSSPVDALRQFLFKHDEWYITLDEVVQYRLVSATVGQGLLLAAPESIGYSPPFAPPPAIRTFKIVRGHGIVSSEPLEVTFIAIPVEPAG